jgi:tRNA(Met) cytidine acetyltransferase
MISHTFGETPLHVNDHIQAAISAHLACSVKSRQRRLIVMSGERDWSKKQLEQYLDSQPFSQALCISDVPFDGIDNVPCQQARRFLGQQLDCLVYDVWSGFDPDALAAVVGCISGGGLLILLVPELSQWPTFADPDYQRLLVHPFDSDAITGRFVHHVISSLRGDKCSLLIEQGKELVYTAEPVADELTEQLPADSDCLTQDQADAVEAVCALRHGHAHRPLVITADRGRGKSTALGIASARLMQQRESHIVITAPRPASVMVAFEHASTLLPGHADQNQTMNLQWQDSSLRFIAADKLVRQSETIDLLLVDEAAAIPAAMLEQLLKKYPRIVFVTTVHGYEGTGRGFDIRFKQTLQKITPQWKALQLTQPIRWAANDPVERWLFDALLLDAKPVSHKQLSSLSAEQCVIEKLNRDDLLADKQSLSELFGLLVCAHYQTTPADLRILLDGVNVSVWVTRYCGHVVAAALVAEEGGFDELLSEHVWKGERRPRGHMLPQTLAAHGGFAKAPALRYLRVIRVAVHPAVQRQSLGKKLINAIVEQARLDQYDFVGSSFAASHDVVSFWRDINFVPVMLGVTRDASSGCHSLLMLSALSLDGGELLAEARKRFNQQFPRELMSLHSQLEAQLVSVLMLGTDGDNDFNLDQQQWLDVEAFADYNRQYNHCLLPLWKLSCLCLSNEGFNKQLEQHQRELLIARVLQNQSQQSVIDSMDFAGKKELQTSMRNVIAKVRLMLIERMKDSK